MGWLLLAVSISAITTGLSGVCILPSTAADELRLCVAQVSAMRVPCDPCGPCVECGPSQCHVALGQHCPQHTAGWGGAFLTHNCPRSAQLVRGF